MKFYTTTNSSVGEGVEATVIYHENNGDELLCVRAGFELFEEVNPDATEVSADEADNLLADKSVKLAVPTKTEIRTDNKLTREEIQAEIDNKDTPTVNVAEVEEKDAEGKSVQKLTYFEDREINSVEDFLASQADQSSEPEAVKPSEAQTETPTI